MGGAGVNIKKVAEMAGVSVATISRVLNHPEQVTPETRAHVVSVMEQANYMPNWFARGLTLGHTNTIAALIPSTEYGTYLKIMSGIETVARNNKYAVLICHTHHSNVIEADCLRMVIERNVDGVILTSSKLPSERTALLEEFEIPFVHIGKRKLERYHHTCYIDYEGAAAELTGHLLSLGHRKIDLLMDEEESDEAEQMLAGYQRAMDVGGSARSRVHQAENSLRGGLEATQRLLEEGSLPDALITANDEQAFGVLKTAQDAGIDVPGTLAVVSISDSPACSILSPPLTSMELPARHLGRMAAQMLLDIIANRGFESDFPQEFTLQARLIVRRSCGSGDH
jgi:LacI family transcriptional regulator